MTIGLRHSFGFVLAGSLFASGCAPSVSGLLADHHYREAIASSCGKNGAVSEAIFASLDPWVHVHAVTETELARVGGSDEARAALSRGSIVRIELVTNRIPVDGIAVALSFPEGIDGAADYEALARLTKETLPHGHFEKTYLTSRNVAVGMATLLTGGLFLLVNPRIDTGRTVPPTETEYRLAAPKTAALHAALVAEGASLSQLCRPEPAGGASSEPLGVRCKTFAVVPVVMGTSFDVTITASFYAKTERPADEVDDPRCVVKHAVTLKVGRPAESFGAWASTTFGSKSRRLAELGATPVDVPER